MAIGRSQNLVVPNLLRSERSNGLALLEVFLNDLCLDCSMEYQGSRSAPCPIFVPFHVKVGTLSQVMVRIPLGLPESGAGNGTKGLEKQLTIQ